MGDISEIRILLVAGCLIGIFAFILVSIPQPLLPASERETAAVSYPDGWESGDLLYISETWNSTTISNTTDTSFTFGGRDMRVKGSWTAAYGPSLLIYEYWYEWLVFYKLEPCDWLDATGYFYNSTWENSLIMSVLDANGYDQSERFICRWTEHSQFKMYAILSYDTGTYTDFEDAMNNGALGLWLGIQFDQTNTSYNAWDIIGMILFFSMPDVDPFLNAIVSVPIWIAIAYASFILLLRAIGAIFGGGA